MPSFRSLVAACAALLAASSICTAGATEVTIGEAKIAFSPPQGYCELDRREALDGRFIDVMAQAMGPGVRILSAFADCTQLSIWRKGLLSYLQDYGFLTTAANDTRRGLDRGRADVVQELARKLSQIDVDAAAAAARRRSEGTTMARLGETEPLGVLRADEDAVYYGIIAQVTTAEGRVRDALQVAATTLIKGRLVSYLLYGEFRGRPSVDALLAMQQTNVGRLIAAN